MNYIIIRTKLQARIAMRLVELSYLEKPFTVVRLHESLLEEDDKSVYLSYEELERIADKSYTIIQASGFWKNVFSLLEIFTSARLSNGKVYLACINWYAAAVALYIMPKQDLFTYDDGTGNVVIIDDDCSYHTLQPLQGKSLKRRLARAFFPQGASAFIRSRISLHYTIYPNRENIVPFERLRFIEMSWARALTPADLESLPKQVNTILLGAAYRDHANGERLAKLATDIASKVDLYLPHPRERSEASLCLSATAESVIEYYADANNLTVFHFGSSAALAFDASSHIKFIDLLKERGFRPL